MAASDLLYDRGSGGHEVRARAAAQDTVWAAQQVQGVRRCIAAAQRPLRARAGAQQVQGLWRQLHLRARAAACAKAVIRSIIY